MGQKSKKKDNRINCVSTDMVLMIQNKLKTEEKNNIILIEEKEVLNNNITKLQKIINHQNDLLNQNKTRINSLVLEKEELNKELKNLKMQFTISSNVSRSLIDKTNKHLSVLLDKEYCSEDIYKANIEALEDLTIHYIDLQQENKLLIRKHKTLLGAICGYTIGLVIVALLLAIF